MGVDGFADLFTISASWTTRLGHSTSWQDNAHTSRRCDTVADPSNPAVGAIRGTENKRRGGIMIAGVTKNATMCSKLESKWLDGVVVKTLGLRLSVAS